MTIAIFEISPEEEKTFTSLEKRHSVGYTAQPLTRENASDFSQAEVLSTFIFSKLDRAVLAQFPKLKLICTRSTGFDHIDLDYCREKGVVVSNVPTYGKNTVAEHVFGLLLTISHHLYEAIDRTRKGDFSLEGLCGFDLQGKTLGVIGVGEIGQNVISIAKGFGMRVLAYDIAPDESLADRLGFEYVTMDTLLTQADIVSPHVPANPKTAHLLSDPEFSKMKKGVVLINTARGSVVDEQALLKALMTGKVAAAGLDVLPEEPVVREEAELLHCLFQEKQKHTTLLADHVLMRQRNVFITPHSAFNTKEAVGRILMTTLENMEAFLSGAPQNTVTPPGARIS